MSDEETTTTPPTPEEPPPRPRRDSSSTLQVIFGALLVVIGAAWLLERTTQLDLTFWPLAIGLILLVPWFRDRNFGLLIAGSIVSGVGLGIFLQDFLPSSWGSVVIQLCIAAGFAAIPILSGRRSMSWGWIVAAVLGITALIDAGVEIGRFVPAEIRDVLLPVSLVGLGLVLIFRRSLDRQVASVLTIALVIIFVAALAVRGSGFFSFDFPGFGSDKEQTQKIELPILEGKTLVVQGGSGDVRLETGDLSGAAVLRATGRNEQEASERLQNARIDVEEVGDQVIVNTSTTGPSFLSRVSTSFRFSLPEGSKVRVQVGSGNIRAELSGGDVSLSTGSGEVRLTGSNFTNVSVNAGSGDLFVRIDDSDGRATVSTGSGDIEIDVTDTPNLEVRTGSGDVSAKVSGDPTLNLRSNSGDIDVEGWGTSGNFDDRFEREGADGEVVIQTGSGDIKLEEAGGSGG